MGVFTNWNQGAKKIVEKGFIALYSPLNVERLQKQLLDTLIAPSRQKFKPDRYDVVVNNLTFQRTFRGSMKAVLKLESEMEAYLLKNVQKRHIPVVTAKITVKIRALSSLSRKEIRIRARVSDEDEIMTMIAPPLYKLELLKSADSGKKEWLLEPGKRYIIGRGKDCDIMIEQKNISHVHTEIEITDNYVIWLSDKGSTNKTYINDNPAPIIARTQIAPGTKIQLAQKNPVVLIIRK